MAMGAMNALNVVESLTPTTFQPQLTRGAPVLAVDPPLTLVEPAGHIAADCLMLAP